MSGRDCDPGTYVFERSVPEPVGQLVYTDAEPDVIRAYMLRALREALGLSLGEGARVLGCAVYELSDVERGNRSIDDASWKRVVGVLQAEAATRRVKG